MQMWKRERKTEGGGRKGRADAEEQKSRCGKATAQLNKNIIKKRPNAETGKRTAAV